MALLDDPKFKTVVTYGELEIDADLEHDASKSAAIVAVELISSARLAAKLDSVYTQYSFQYLLDNARPKKKGGKYKRKGGKAPKKKRVKAPELTVKHCLEFALKEGIPKAEHWVHFGSVSLSKLSSSYKPPLVSMKGEVIEAANIKDFSMDQPFGAKLHVFRPQIDLVGEGIYYGGSGEPSCYVGLRDAIVLSEEKLNGKSIATVKLWYKNQFQIVRVSMTRMFRDYSRGIEPTLLLVEYCVPCLSVD